MPQPPATLTLRYCATCGRDDLRSSVPAAHYEWDGGMPTGEWCPGTVQTLTYRLAPSGQPEPEYEYRAIVADDGTADREESQHYCDLMAVQVALVSLMNAEPPYDDGWIERRVKCIPGPWERLDVPDTSREARVYEQFRVVDGYRERRRVEGCIPGPWERLDVPDTTGEQ